MPHRTQNFQEKIDLFADPIGRIAIQHESINSKIRLTLETVFSSRVRLYPKTRERLIYSSTSLELRSLYSETVRQHFFELDCAYSESVSFGKCIDQLGRYLSNENTGRNRILHADWDLASKNNENTLEATFKKSTKDGQLVTSIITADWLVGFIGFQHQLMRAVEEIYDIVFEDDINTARDKAVGDTLEDYFSSERSESDSQLLLRWADEGRFDDRFLGRIDEFNGDFLQAFESISPQDFVEWYFIPKLIHPAAAAYKNASLDMLANKPTSQTEWIVYRGY